MTPHDAVRTLLVHIGENPAREGLIDTPRRVVEALAEMTDGYSQDPAKILARVFKADTNEMVVVKGIPYASLCEHHMLPFTGHVTIGYIPHDGHVVGLSKLPRLVQCYARRLQMQEVMTRQIADAIMAHLKPTGVGVITTGVHACCHLRGARSHNEMVTSALKGSFLTNPEVKSEFVALSHAR